MGLFGLRTAKEVEEEKRKAAEKAKIELEQNNLTNLSNLSKGSQVNFAIPYFDVFDPRLMDYGVPCSVHGSIVYSIDDLDLFHQINKNEAYSDETFKNKLRAQVTKFVKGVVTNIPSEAQIPVVQIERKIMEISDLIQQRVAPQVERILGITVRSLDITNIIIDKDSYAYREVKELTAELERENKLAQHHANLSNFNLQNSLNQDHLRAQSALDIDAMKRQQELNLGRQEALQDMQLENERETMRIQREEMQRASRLQTEQTFLGAHQANLNANILNHATDSLHQQTGGGMFAQTTVGRGMPQMPQMGGMSQPNVNQSTPQVQYMVGVNGQPTGPFDWNQLMQLVRNGQLTRQTLVWKQNMPQWEMAGQVLELQPLFNGQAPSMNGMPPMM